MHLNKLGGILPESWLPLNPSHCKLGRWSNISDERWVAEKLLNPSWITCNEEMLKSEEGMLPESLSLIYPSIEVESFVTIIIMLISLSKTQGFLIIQIAY